MRFLVGIDLAVVGHDWLLDRAARFALAVGGVIDLVYVASAPNKEHAALLQGLLTLLPEGCRGTTLVETGDPADRLIALTSEYSALIVGPREPAALQRWLLGPMAVRVMKRSVCPILVPRGERPPTANPRILVGVDAHGEAMNKVLEFSSEWAHKLQGTLDAVYAVPAALPPIQNKQIRESAEREFMASKEQERVRVEEILAAAVPESHRGIGRLGAGEPEDVLVQMSNEYDLVCVGNRGRKGIGRLIMGNVANYVVRAAHCDVLVLPTAALFGDA